MDDEVLARLAALIGMVQAGEHERLLDPSPVDVERCLVRVLLDDREQIAEQPTLDRRQLDVLDLAPGLGMLDAPDRGARHQLALVAGPRRRAVPPARAIARPRGAVARRRHDFFCRGVRALGLRGRAMQLLTVLDGLALSPPT